MVAGHYLEGLRQWNEWIPTASSYPSTGRKQSKLLIDKKFRQSQPNYHPFDYRESEHSVRASWHKQKETKPSLYSGSPFTSVDRGSWIGRIAECTGYGTGRRASFKFRESVLAFLLLKETEDFCHLFENCKSFPDNGMKEKCNLASVENRLIP